MKTIKQTYEINAPVSKVWEALTDEKIIELWGAGPAAMSDEEGFEFFLWDGDIYGKNIEVIKQKKLVQDWYEADVKKKTKVTFTLSEKDGITTVELFHEDVPDEKFSDIESGWKEYYMGPLTAWAQEAFSTQN